MSSAGSDEVGARIAAVGGWRSEALASLRELIRRAAPDVVEELKWRKPANPDGVPTWSVDGIVCTGESYKDKVKLTFAHGAALDDRHALFNASLDGNARRAIDVREGETIDPEAFVALVQAAVAHNREREAAKAR